MSKTVGIRYKTAEGQEGVWWLPRASVRDDSPEALKKFLAHWHPEYEFLGKASGDPSAADAKGLA